MALEIGWMQLLAASLMTLFMTTSAQNRFPEVALIPTETEVLEGESVELCVMLFNQDLLSESASLTLITNDLSGSLSDVNANSDYIPLREEIVFTPTGPSSICVTFQTLRDNVVEDTEALSIMLVNVSGVVANLRSVFLSILPANDRIVVDFLNTAFTVSEGDGTLNLSVQLTAGGIERAFPSTVEVEFSITDLTTEGSNDYVGPTSISFSAGEPVNTVKIFQIGIIDDQQVEGAERFALVIVSDSVQPVTTSGTGVAIVTLSDNDVASVALTSPPRSSVPEDGSEGVMSNVQVCVQLVLSYPIPLDRDVFVILDTEDVTTDSSDYSLPEALLAFQPGSTSTAELCTTFSIVPDLNEEIDEEVVIRLFPVAPDVTFEGREKSIIVTIMNDDVNCPIPPFPVILDARDGLIEGATAIYSCSLGFQLNGEAERQCVNGAWTGQEPACIVTDCGNPPPLENGYFELDTNTIVNSTARYFCNTTDSSRKRVDTEPNEIQCLPSGTWSELNFDCENDSGSSAGLGGGGIAAIVIVSLLILVGADTLVIIFLGWYWCKYKSDKTKRSGKYAVDNKEPNPVDNSIALPTLSTGTEQGLGVEYIATSTPTDV